MAQVIWQKRAEKELYNYYYAQTTDKVHIADVWDMRREPSKLSKRIK
jgi:hypothetical protein